MQLISLIVVVLTPVKAVMGNILPLITQLCPSGSTLTALLSRLAGKIKQFEQKRQL